jgi:hypothetical protein
MEKNPYFPFSPKLSEGKPSSSPFRKGRVREGFG